MSEPSAILSNLDFDTLKNTFKAYLRGQDRFKDYDFEGSNMSVLLDLLSYNTFMNSFYLNMIGNEMFLDSAQLRDSVVSHSKELNYVPRSFTSSRAIVDILINTTDPEKRNISIPKGTSFTAKTISESGGKNYTFTTDRNIVITNKIFQSPTGATFLGSGIELYEGTYRQESYAFINGNEERILVNNQTADISSLKVTVIEDSGATTHLYTRADSLFGLDENSKVFFIQGAENYKYEIFFGDGVIGRRPLNNSIVLLEYRICNGELPNGLSIFTPDGSIDSETNIKVTAVGKSSGGAIAETIDSIKFNAPRAFTTQERAVTTEDFENLLKQNFPEINAVSAYGGEQLNPPQFGKVFVAVDLKETDSLPQSKRDQYLRFLKPRSIVSIDPVFVNPDYVYVSVNSKIKYNINVTPINEDDIRTLVLTSITSYAQNHLNNFNKTLRYSKLVKEIDNSSHGIISNETDIIGLKYFIPEINVTRNYKLTFGFPLKTVDESGEAETKIITSTAFTFNDQRVFIEDDGNGNLNLVGSLNNGPQHVSISTVGSVDYENGILYLNSFNVSSFEGKAIKIFGKPASKDISSTKDIILNILDEDVTIEVNALRE